MTPTDGSEECKLIPVASLSSQPGNDLNVATISSNAAHVIESKHRVFEGASLLPRILQYLEMP